ncbi:MAG: ergothioneine biosynthesis protein EgtC [Cyanothece sp. SIO1E1]|nr:ergothioneine biosynthesis protein EgtC [Cyanothece sp. SIO1E1]
MCRLLGYLGPPTPLEHLIYKPEHSLIVQSYQPRELEIALLNADGFGVGWYHAQRQMAPFTYRNTSPIWNDINLPQISRYVESGCVLANIRSATPGLAVDLSNCQPFTHQHLLFVHNGFIEDFRQTLYRPIRDRLTDTAYKAIHGLTDSEHIFALLIHELETAPGISLELALHRVLMLLSELAGPYQVRVAANIIISTGNRLIACRFDNQTTAPSFYWLRNHPMVPEALVLASEPFFAANWMTFPESSIISVGEDLEIHTRSLSCRAA